MQSRIERDTYRSDAPGSFENRAFCIKRLMKNFAIIQHLKSALFSVASSVFGVNEVLFVGGLAMLFSGLAGLWSMYGALTVCGSVLIIVGVWGAASGGRGKGSNA